MAEWRMESWTRAGSYLATLPARNLQGEIWYSKPKQLRFELPLYHPAITRTNIDPGKTELRLFRDNVHRLTMVLWDATASSGDGKLSCSAESLESYLEMRRVDQDLRYSAAPGSAIIWDLINRAQTGTDAALGFVQGTLQTAPNRTVSYLKDDLNMYSDIIAELADNSSLGFDWEIDHLRRLQVYYPRPQVQSRARLEWGGVVTGYSIQVQGKYGRNNIIVKGDEAIRSSAVIDTAKRAEYGLRQYADSNTGLTTVTAANEAATRLLNLRRSVRETPQIALKTALVNPWDGDIWMGQLAPLIINDGWSQFNQSMRCEGFQFSIGKHGSETIVLYMSDLREVS
jgi:hypothetical protein